MIAKDVEIGATYLCCVSKRWVRVKILRLRDGPTPSWRALNTLTNREITVTPRRLKYIGNETTEAPRCANQSAVPAAPTGGKTASVSPGFFSRGSVERRSMMGRVSGEW